MPVVSVIVPVYNAQLLTMRCIQSLVMTLGPMLGPAVEIIISDDCSPEWNPLEWLGPPLTVLRNEKNLGVGPNLNRASQMATGQYLFFLNSDTIAQPNWLPFLGTLMENNPKVGIAGPKLLFPDGTIQSCGGFYDVGKGPYHRYLGFKADYPLANIEESVPWITGAALMVRTELFRSLGGFDEAYRRAYFEDVDLCEQVKQAGYEIWYCPQSVFIHHVGQSTSVKDDQVKAFRAVRSFNHNAQRWHDKWDRVVQPNIGSRMVPY